jgi:hypothetical protein
MIQAFAEAAQDASPEEMMRLLQQMGDVIMHDPDVAGLGSFTGSSGGARPPTPVAASSCSSRATSASSHHRRSSIACGRSSPRSRAPT